MNWCLPILGEDGYNVIQKDNGGKTLYYPDDGVDDDCMRLYLIYRYQNSLKRDKRTLAVLDGDLKQISLDYYNKQHPKFKRLGAKIKRLSFLIPTPTHPTTPTTSVIMTPLARLPMAGLQSVVSPYP